MTRVYLSRQFTNWFSMLSKSLYSSFNNITLLLIAKHVEQWNGQKKYRPPEVFKLSQGKGKECPIYRVSLRGLAIYDILQMLEVIAGTKREVLQSPHNQLTTLHYLLIQQKCDQVAKLFFKFWLYTTMIICPEAYKICLSRFRISLNAK